MAHDTCHDKYPAQPLNTNNETIPEPATVSVENTGFSSVLYEITDLQRTKIHNKTKIKSFCSVFVLFSVQYMTNLNLLNTTVPWSNS